MNRADLWIPGEDWNKYESYIFGSLQRRFPTARVSPNVHLPGLKSGRKRQIDVLVERSDGGLDIKIALDCKCYKRKVTVKDIETFLGMLDDVRVSKGVLVTTKGYSKRLTNAHGANLVISISRYFARNGFLNTSMSVVRGSGEGRSQPLWKPLTDGLSTIRESRVTSFQCIRSAILSNQQNQCVPFYTAILC
jgi:hypothetical protein